MATPDFSRIDWESDGFVLDDWQFKEHPDDHSGMPSGTDDWFWFFKPRSMVNDYADVFSKRPELDISNMLELGIWDGGSVAFWSLMADPDHLAAVDLSDRGDSTYFKKFAASRPTIRTSWATDQEDEAALLRLIAEQHLEPVDVVIDDASHRYASSRRSFEVLFPKVRPGGIYILEDWQWSFEPSSLPADSELATQRALVDLVHDLLGVMASSPDLITKIEVYPLFVVIERGAAPLPRTLDLHSLINRREGPSLSKRWEQVRRRLTRETAKIRQAIRH